MWCFCVYVLDKYLPTKLLQCVNKGTVAFLEDWLKRGHKKPLLIYGKTGVGKSTLVHLFAKEHNFFLFELSPSDDRDKKSIESTLNAVSQSRSIFANTNLLFFDDIDVLTEDDRGGFEAILSTAKESRNPVIFCATNLYADKKLSELRDACEMVQIKALSSAIIFSILIDVCTAQKIHFEKDALSELAKLNEGDLRSTFLDLDFLSPFGVTQQTLGWVSGRERKGDVFKTVIGLFGSKSFGKSKEIADLTEVDYDMLFSWIVENSHLFYKDASLREAFNYISLADINKARIYIRQNWVFFKYFIALGIIAPTLVPKKDHFTYKISYPQAIKMRARDVSTHSKNKKASQILSKILRGSVSKISGELFFYKFFFESGGFAKYLQEHLPDDDLKFLGDFFKVDLGVEKEDKEKERKVEPKKETEKIEPEKKLEKKENLHNSSFERKKQEITEKEEKEKRKEAGQEKKKEKVGKEKKEKEKKESEIKQRKLF